MSHTRTETRALCFTACRQGHRGCLEAGQTLLPEKWQYSSGVAYVGARFTPKTVFRIRMPLNKGTHYLAYCYNKGNHYHLTSGIYDKGTHNFPVVSHKVAA